MARFIALLLLFVSAIATVYAATQSDLDRGLAAARRRWGADALVRIHFEPLNPCDLNRERHPRMAATTREPMLKIAGGAQADDRQNATATILINSNCDWNSEPLQKVIIHEYGHALGLGHSGNPFSIMYWIVYPDFFQSITRGDRAALRRLQHPSIESLSAR